MEYPFRLHVRMNGVLSSRDPLGRVNDKTGGIDAKTRSLWLWLKMPQRPPLRFLWVEANRRLRSPRIGPSFDQGSKRVITIFCQLTLSNAPLTPFRRKPCLRDASLKQQ